MVKDLHKKLKIKKIHLLQLLYQEITQLRGLFISLNDEQKKNISIIGFENHKISKLLNLTTIEIPLFQIGKSLFNQLYEDKLNNYLFETKLIKRNSVFKLNH